MLEEIVEASAVEEDEVRNFFELSLRHTQLVELSKEYINKS